MVRPWDTRAGRQNWSRHQPPGSSLPHLLCPDPAAPQSSLPRHWNTAAPLLWPRLLPGLQTQPQAQSCVPGLSTRSLHVIPAQHIRNLGHLTPTCVSVNTHIHTHTILIYTRSTRTDTHLYTDTRAELKPHSEQPAPPNSPGAPPPFSLWATSERSHLWLSTLRVRGLTRSTSSKSASPIPGLAHSRPL